MKAENLHKSSSQENYPELGQYFLMGASKNDMWQFFNPQKRVWEFLKIQKEDFGSYKNSVILRNGWIIRKLQKRRPSFYYLAKESKVISINSIQAAKEAQKYLTGEVEVKAYLDNDVIKINLNQVYFPINEYNKIMNLGVNVLDHMMFVPQRCLNQFESILKEIGIKLSLTDKDIEDLEDKRTDSSFRKKVSDLLTLLYSKYLKKESEIEELAIALLSRQIDLINEPDVRKALEFITKEDKTQEEQSLISFLTEVVVTYFDWKLLSKFNVDSSLHGLVIGSTPKSYQGIWTWNYLKVILPNFESVNHLQTTISPSREGKGKMHQLSARLDRILIKKWRLYPYLGKLKNTGTKDEVSFEYSDVGYIKSSLRTITGIPTIEKILSEMCFLDSFSLDLEEWKGSDNLSRYFLMYVKIIEPLDPSAKIPSMLVEDFFGIKFRIVWEFNTYLHYAADIHKIHRNDLISIIVKNSLESEYLHKDETDFKTVFGLSFRFVNKFDFVSKNVLALIKYVGYTDVELLKSLVTKHCHISVDEILSELEKKNQILIRNNVCYYSYNALTIDQFSYLIDMMENPEAIPPREFFMERWYVLWSLIREDLPIIHPLSYSTNINPLTQVLVGIPSVESILEFMRKTKLSHKQRMSERAKRRTNYLINTRKLDTSFQDTMVGQKDEDVYINHAKYMFRQFGQASIKARGRWIPKAHYIAKYLSRLFSYMEPRITRSDKSAKDPTGRDVREVEFYVEAYKIG